MDTLDKLSVETNAIGQNLIENFERIEKQLYDLYDIRPAKRSELILTAP